MVIKIVAKIKKSSRSLLDFTFINIIDDYQKFESH
jgi:hypothetical protein